MRRTSSQPTPTRSASAPGCLAKAPPVRSPCFRRCSWSSSFSSGTSAGWRTGDRRREVEEVALVLPADGHVHRGAPLPVLLYAGDHGEARRPALPAVEPRALFAVLDLVADARPRPKPLAGDAVRHLDVEHDADRARGHADLALLRRDRRLCARAP